MPNPCSISPIIFIMFSKIWFLRISIYSIFKMAYNFSMLNFLETNKNNKGHNCLNKDYS